MSKTTEQRTVVEVHLKGTQKSSFERYFCVNIPSLDDEFLKHEPMTIQQARFKNALISAIKSGLFDSRSHRTLYLGSFIKYLVEEQGYTVSNAWRVVCDDDGCSKSVGWLVLSV